MFFKKSEVREGASLWDRLSIVFKLFEFHITGYAPKVMIIRLFCFGIEGGDYHSLFSIVRSQNFIVIRYLFFFELRINKSQEDKS